MRRAFTIVLIFILLLLLCMVPVLAAQSVPKEVLSASKSVVRIMSEYSDSYCAGSGFIISAESGSTYIATNYHVVSDFPHSISVWTNSDVSVSAKLYAADSECDICILKINHSIEAAPLLFSPSEAKQGDAVYAVGFPIAADNLTEDAAITGCEATITDGIVSAVRKTRIANYGEAVDMLQISAAINSGNSGGPLFNSHGEVIGINTFGVVDSQGIFASVAISELETLMEKEDIPVTRASSAARSAIFIIIGCLIIAAAAVFLIITLFRKSARNARPEAETLRSFVDGRAVPISENEAVSLMIPLALELKTLHESGVAHLELSPDSILISNGIAVLPEKTNVESHRYSSGFTAPEIYRGKNYGAKSDIYSLCSLLSYLITGNVPENALNRTDGTAEPTAKESDDTALSLTGIISRGMSIQADLRYASMQEIIYDLIPYNCPAPISEPTVKEARTSAEPIPVKTRRRSRVKILIPVIAASVVILVCGAYFGTYLKAVSLCENGSFKNADRYLILPSVTKLHDAKLLDYVTAGVMYENEQYTESETEFRSLSGYRRADEMATDSQYMYAAFLSEAHQYYDALKIYRSLAEQSYKDSEALINETTFDCAVYELYENQRYYLAVNLFESLVEDGYDGADSMVKEAKYLWACELVLKENWTAAYKKYYEIRGYADALERTLELRDIIYSAGQDSYHNGDYEKAAGYFRCISHIYDSDDYITLISVKTCTVFPLLADFYIKDLVKLFYFEDASDILISNTDFASRFLSGAWKSSGGYYYFEVSETTYNTSYNLPWSEAGTYHVTDGTYYITNSSGDIKPQFTFTLISPDIMDVYCFADGSTITLYRQ